MGVLERRQREREGVRERIMDAARELFAAEGFAAVSMRRVAAAVEYSPTAIYDYFADKDDLLRQICEADFAAFHAGQAKSVAAETDPVARIRLMGRAYVRFAVKHPNHFRRMFLDPPAVPLSDHDRACRGDPTVDGYAYFRLTVADASAAGRLRAEFAGNVELATQVLWAAVHGVASLAVAHAGPESWVKLRPAAKLADSTIDSILRGVCCLESSTRKVPR